MLTEKWSEFHKINLPVIYVLKDKIELSFFCQFCNQTHHHSLEEGPRKSHCVNQNSPYFGKNYYLVVRPGSHYISKRLRFDVLSRDQFRCVYCGVGPQGARLQVDHKIPKSKGGTNNIHNLVTACLDCNLGKSDRI